MDKQYRLFFLWVLSICRPQIWSYDAASGSSSQLVALDALEKKLFDLDMLKSKYLTVNKIQKFLAILKQKEKCVSFKTSYSLNWYDNTFEIMEVVYNENRWESARWLCCVVCLDCGNWYSFFRACTFSCKNIFLFLLRKAQLLGDNF